MAHLRHYAETNIPPFCFWLLCRHFDVLYPMFGYFVLFQIVFFFKIAMLLEFNVLCFMRTVEKWLDLLNTNYDADNTIDSF